MHDQSAYPNQTHLQFPEHSFYIFVHVIPKAYPVRVYQFFKSQFQFHLFYEVFYSDGVTWRQLNEKMKLRLLVY